MSTKKTQNEKTLEMVTYVHRIMNLASVDGERHRMKILSVLLDLLDFLI